MNKLLLSVLCILAGIANASISDQFDTETIKLTKTNKDKLSKDVAEFAQRSSQVDKLIQQYHKDDPIFVPAITNGEVTGALSAMIGGVLAMMEEENNIAHLSPSTFYYNFIKNEYGEGNVTEYFKSSTSYYDILLTSLLNGTDGYYYFVFLVPKDDNRKISLHKYITDSLSGKLEASRSEIHKFRIIKDKYIKKNKLTEETYKFVSLVNEFVFKAQSGAMLGMIYIDHKDYYKIIRDVSIYEKIANLKRTLPHYMLADTYTPNVDCMKGLDSIRMLHGDNEFPYKERWNISSKSGRTGCGSVISLSLTDSPRIHKTERKTSSTSKPPRHPLALSISNSEASSISPRVNTEYNIQFIYSNIPSEYQSLFNSDLTFNLPEARQKERELRSDNGKADEVATKVVLIDNNMSKKNGYVILQRHLESVLEEPIVPKNVRDELVKYRDCNLELTIKAQDQVKERILVDISETTFIPIKLLKQVSQPQYVHVLNMWFNGGYSDQWWNKASNDDGKLKRDKWLRMLLEAAINGELSEWRQTDEGALAEIIVIDQFSHIIFRGKSKAYSHAQNALFLAQIAVKQGFLNALTTAQKKFFMLLPIIHSESEYNHESIQGLLKAEFLEDANKHFELIKLFGRYPQLNPLHNRTSTEEELKFLQQNPNYF